MNKPRSLAYLQARYPTLSMIFVIREVLQLRRLGFAIDVASVNPADRALERLTEAERGEAERTYYIKPHGVRGALAAHARTLLGSPRAWLRGVRLALRHGGFDLRAATMHLMYLTEALMVGVWMRRLGHRHVHVHLGSQPATVGLYVKRVFGFGLSITVHGPDEFYDAERQLLGAKVAAADFVCCISDFARSQLMKQSSWEHWHKLVVVRLGVDPSLFAPPQAVPPRDDALFELLCIGRLTPAKGQHVLLEALAVLLAQGRRLRARVVGAGIDDESLRAHARALHLDPESVVFEGAIDQDRIRDFYARADAFCLPSFAEGVPVVLMEAMAMQIPCVTTPVAGIPELIRDGIDGLLVSPSNVQALADALARLMDDAALRLRLGQAGRARVLAGYDLARNVQALAAVFEQRIAR